jgi:hypothetical protein
MSVCMSVCNVHMHVMQCDAMQCNVMQRNVMQCNECMYVSADPGRRKGQRVRAERM